MTEKNETVDIEVDVPEEYGVLLYDTGNFSFRLGLNVLVGCNGTGKTTLMRLVADAVKTRPGAAVRMFSTVRESHDGPGSLLLSDRDEDTVLAATMLISSEGERMAEILRKVFRWLGLQMGEEGTREIWLMLDSVDSGLDLPTIRVVKEVLGDVVRDAAGSGVRVFVLMAANGYAMVEGEDTCIDVSTGRLVSFDGWDEYADFCVASDKAKATRYDRIVERERKHG